MRKNLFLLGAVLAAGLAFTSCSSEKDEGSGNGVKDGNEAYIALRLITPTVSGTTRAYTTEDGDASEYAVHNGIIVFFENTTNDNQLDATFVSAFNLTDLTSTTNKGTEVSSQWTSMLNITEAGFTAESNRYALVILNRQSAFEVDGTGLNVNGTALTKSSKFSEVMKTQIPSASLGNGTKYTANENIQTSVDASAGLLMTNAPLSPTTGGATPTGVQYLTNITNNIKSTQTEAQDAPAKIYVERAAAKIQVNNAATQIDNARLNDGTAAVTISSISWIPDNTTSTFNTVREVAQGDFNVVKTGGNNYRFTGTAKVYDSDLYRTTWAIDNMYSDDYTTPLATVAQSQPTGMLDNNAVAYVPENTMDYNKMYQHNTTRVIVKAIMGDGTKDYYSSGVLGLNKIYEKANMETALATYAKGLPEASGITGTLTCTLTDGTGTGIGTATVAVTSSNASDDVSSLQTKLSDITVNRFVGGACYYKIQVQHFNPGSAATDEVALPVTTNGSDYNDVYPTTNQKNDYLGLYGVVRNTWYLINVTKIANVGTSTVPVVPPSTPDDEVNSYLSAKINVMQWAKRTQQATL